MIKNSDTSMAVSMETGMETAPDGFLVSSSYVVGGNRTPGETTSRKLARLVVDPKRVNGKTCKRGHPMTEENTRVRKHYSGYEWNQCRECDRDSKRRYRKTENGAKKNAKGWVRHFEKKGLL